MNERFESCFKWSQFVSFFKLVKTVSWVLKIKQIWMNKVISKNKIKTNCTELTTSDISYAKLEYLSMHRRKCFQPNSGNCNKGNQLTRTVNCYHCNPLCQTSSFVSTADYPTPIYHFAVSIK